MMFRRRREHVATVHQLREAMAAADAPTIEIVDGEEPPNTVRPVSLDDLAGAITRSNNQLVHWQAERARADTNIADCERALAALRSEFAERCLTLGLRCKAD